MVRVRVGVGVRVRVRRAESWQAGAPPGARTQAEQQRAEHEVSGKHGVPRDARGQRAARPEVAMRQGRERGIPQVGRRAGAQCCGEPGGRTHVGCIEERPREQQRLRGPERRSRLVQLLGLGQHLFAARDERLFEADGQVRVLIHRLQQRLLTSPQAAAAALIIAN